MSALSLRPVAAWRDLLTLTKPGILLGNLLAVLGGYGLAAAHQPRAGQPLLALLIGAGLIIACAGVFNNLIDQDMDRLMRRTQARCSVLARLSSLQCLLWGIALLILGSACLLCNVNLLTMVLAWIGLFIYLVPYSLYFKRRSWIGLWVGALAGAMPPVMGYCALVEHIDRQALWLFFTVCLWQIPHAHAIAVRHLEDYRRAQVALLPITHGPALVRQRMPGYIAIFTLVAALPAVWGNANPGCLTALVSGLLWQWAAWQWRAIADNQRWATRHFQFSLAVILLFNLALWQPLIP